MKIIKLKAPLIKTRIARQLHSPVPLWLANFAVGLLGVSAWVILILDWMGKIHVY